MSMVEGLYTQAFRKRWTREGVGKVYLLMLMKSCSTASPMRIVLSMEEGELASSSDRDLLLISSPMLSIVLGTGGEDEACSPYPELIFMRLHFCRLYCPSIYPLFLS